MRGGLQALFPDAHHTQSWPLGQLAMRDCCTPHLHQLLAGLGVTRVNQAPPLLMPQHQAVGVCGAQRRAAEMDSGMHSNMAGCLPFCYMVQLVTRAPAHTLRSTAHLVRCPPGRLPNWSTAQLGTCLNGCPPLRHRPHKGWHANSSAEASRHHCSTRLSSGGPARTAHPSHPGGAAAPAAPSALLKQGGVAIVA